MHTAKTLLCVQSSPDWYATTKQRSACRHGQEMKLGVDLHRSHELGLVSADNAANDLVVLRLDTLDGHLDLLACPLLIQILQHGAAHQPCMAGPAVCKACMHNSHGGKHARRRLAHCGTAAACQMCVLICSADYDSRSRNAGWRAITSRLTCTCPACADGGMGQAKDSHV